MACRKNITKDNKCRWSPYPLLNNKYKMEYIDFNPLFRNNIGNIRHPGQITKIITYSLEPARSISRAPTINSQAMLNKQIIVSTVVVKNENTANEYEERAILFLSLLHLWTK